jgi:hypothetical protein
VYGGVRLRRPEWGAGRAGIVSTQRTQAVSSSSGRVAVAAWKTEQHLRDHYREHGAEFPGASLADYEASAQHTLDVGTYFEFFDDVSSLVAPHSTVEQWSGLGGD